MVKVSVLMPVYKTNEAYLREAIESTLKQTFTDFEFLIVDDCPSDTRESIVKSYNDPRIIYSINAQNMGITGVRNKMIDMAQGEYLAIMDHDDVSLPERFQKQVEILDAHPEIGVVGCKTQRMSNGNFSKNPTNDEDIRLALMRVCAITHPSAMIRKSVLTDNNIRYEEEFSPSEDYALWCRLIPYTKFYNLKDPLFLYRDHAQNTSHAQQGKMRSATLAIQAIVQTQHPALYQEFLFKATHLSKFKLFNLIPFLTVKKQAQKTRVYLFGCLPLLSWKSTSKLQEK